MSRQLASVSWSQKARVSVDDLVQRCEYSPLGSAQKLRQAMAPLILVVDAARASCKAASATANAAPGMPKSLMGASETPRSMMDTSALPRRMVGTYGCPSGHVLQGQSGDSGLEVRRVRTAGSSQSRWNVRNVRTAVLRHLPAGSCDEDAH